MSMPRFAVQHENDDEPTYVVDHASDPDDEKFEIVELSPQIPWEQRKQIAEMICKDLNERPF